VSPPGPRGRTPRPRPLSVPLLLFRGMTKRCPLCGLGRLFRRWFLVKERCPRCNFPLERIEGHWIGAVGMNTVVSFGSMLATIVVGFAVTHPDPPIGTLLVVTLLVALLVPLLFFPFSRTLWSAIDLAMRPPHPDDDIDPDWIPPGRLSR